MPANNDLGEVRRSQAITTYGPGAIIDFRVDDAAVSVVAGGLEVWDECAPPAGLDNLQKTFEYRLQKQLKIDGFRLPPVTTRRKRWQKKGKPPYIGGYLFPRWMHCPKCQRLRPAGKLDWEAGNPARFCPECTERLPGKAKAYAVPVRFIVACENGHIDDFPWDTWVPHKEDCPSLSTKRRDLRLYSDGSSSGLSGLKLHCKLCGRTNSMEGCFDRDALPWLKCSRRKPWLGDAVDEKCEAKPRTLQRGASNLYFPVISSSLDIPPWSDRIQKRFGEHWDRVSKLDGDKLIGALEGLGLDKKLQMSLDELVGFVTDRRRKLENANTDDLKPEEYDRFVHSDKTPVDDNSEFEVREEPVPPECAHWIGVMRRACRLREVRTITGFTRIVPPGGGADVARYCKIYQDRKRWLPGVEIKGEGIFLTLNQVSLKKWEIQESVISRAELVHGAYVRDWKARHGDVEPPKKISARFLLVHSLAHALISELSILCGYTSASIRERVYCGDGIAGVLLHTGTPDSTGTLGGLARQGTSDKFYELLSGAIKRMGWCSSDPLCVNSIEAVSDSMNLAACHSCQLLPETSCEEFNRLLDRAMLVGTPEQPGIGYFNGFR